MKLSYLTLRDPITNGQNDKLNKYPSTSSLNNHLANRNNLNNRPCENDYRSDSLHKELSFKSGTKSYDQKLSGDSFYKQNASVYNISARHVKTATNIGFGSSSRREHLAIRKETPGPGEYHQNHLIGREGPKYTISARGESKTSKRSFIPGPGQYSIHTKNKPSIPSFRMGTSNREGVIGFVKNIPGPAQYNPNNFMNSFYQKSPNWTMGTAPRKSNRFEEMGPGPGNYNVSKGLGNGPKYSITSKNWEKNIKTAYPGPGQYNNEAISLMHKNPAWKIGTASREDTSKIVIKENSYRIKSYNSNSQKN